MDRGEGVDEGDFGDDGRGMGTRFSNIVGAEVGAGGGEGQK